MIPHHRQAVDMTAWVPSRSTNPDLLVMATHISSDQQAEILTMKGLLAQWGVQDAPDHDNSMDHMGMHIAGMVDGATLNKIQSLSGPSFDALWMTSMINHHQGAIAMAQTEIGQGRNSDAIKLAKMIIGAQQREIAQMNHLLMVSEGLPAFLSYSRVLGLCLRQCRHNRQARQRAVRGRSSASVLESRRRR